MKPTDEQVKNLNDKEEYIDTVVRFGQHSRLAINGFAITLLGITVFNKLEFFGDSPVKILLAIALGLCLVSVAVQIVLNENWMNMAVAAKHEYMQEEQLVEIDTDTGKKVGPKINVSSDKSGKIAEKSDVVCTAATLSAIVLILVVLIISMIRII